jgi:hypothetical protein
MSKKVELAASLFELVLFCAFISISACLSLISSSELLVSGRLLAQTKIVQGLISNSISSAQQQNTRLTLYGSGNLIQLFKNSQILDQHRIPTSIQIKRKGQEHKTSWTEEIYATGSQSPFSLELKNKSASCLISISLRGRVSRKCIQ